MSQLAAAILSLVTVYTSSQTVVYIEHFRKHELGAEGRAEQLATWGDRYGLSAGFDPLLLVSLLHDETGFNARLISHRGAKGLGQLNPLGRWYRGWRSECNNDPHICEERNVAWSAVAFRDALDACDWDEAKAIGFYRSGKCVDAHRAQKVLKLRAWFKEKTKNEVQSLHSTI